MKNGDQCKIGDDGAGGLGGKIMVERVVKEIGSSIQYPELTRTNYNEWALVMQLNHEAKGLWEAIEDGTKDQREDRMELAAVLRAVPSEMRSSLSKKMSAKEAWG